MKGIVRVSAVCHEKVAFTLIELLVAVAVLAIVLVLLLNVASGTLATTRVFNQKMDASMEGRIVVDALAGDLANAVTSRGLAIFGNQAAGTDANAELAFVTQGRGPSASSRFMGVAYRLETGGEMRRFSDTVLWSDQNLPAKAVESPATGTSTTVGKNILRFSVIAVLDNGVTVPLTDSSANATWKLPVDGVSSTPFFAMNLSNKDLRSVRALTIGVVATDEQNFRLLKDLGKMAAAQSAFPAPEMSAGMLTNTPDDWAASLSSGSHSALAGLPQPASAALQVIQTTFPLR